MSTISATDVKNLREMTGAGMMDCKAALTESNGDVEKAIEILRLKGQKLSVKRADRDAKEGVVQALVSADGKRGVAIRLSSETDFVAKNEDFVNLAKEFAEIALDKFPASLEELVALPYQNITIGQKVQEQVGVIGEKIELADYQRLEAPQVVSYVHMGNKAGVIIGLNQADASYKDAGRDVAMQVAAMKPVALNQEGV
ncbi:MAG: translation elongation factor Ts, partial [Bacteroidota bacterium]|nr:translation elongation factor Ts [Bacteroidota bacterium]